MLKTSIEQATRGRSPRTCALVAVNPAGEVVASIIVSSQHASGAMARWLRERRSCRIERVSVEQALELAALPAARRRRNGTASPIANRAA